MRCENCPALIIYEDTRSCALKRTAVKVMGCNLDELYIVEKLNELKAIYDEIEYLESMDMLYDKLLKGFYEEQEN